MKAVFITIFTPASLADPYWREKFLTSIATAEENLRPEKYGSYEPIKTPFVTSSIQAILEDPSLSFFWQRTRPRLEGHANYRAYPHETHSQISIVLEGAEIPQEAIQKLANSLVTAIGCDFGFIHTLSSIEIERWKSTGTVQLHDKKRNLYALVVVPRDLYSYIPDLYWTTFFGKPYIDLFGSEQLRRIPSGILQQITPETVAIQLSENLGDMSDNFEKIDSIRERIKEHLNSNAFFHSSREASHKYNVAAFRRAQAGEAV